VLGGFAVYGLIRAIVGLRLDPEDEFRGADLTIHRVSVVSDVDIGGR